MPAREQWRPIAGYEGLYEVSDRGRMRSIARVLMRRNGAPMSVRSRIRTPSRNSKGYLCVTLHKPGASASARIHCLVAAAFIGPRPRGFEVDHINQVVADNRAVNLRYLSRSRNRLNSSKLRGSVPFHGVFVNRSRFVAMIKVDRVKYRIGSFDTAEEAARARDAKALELLGRDAILNFPRKTVTK